MNVTEQENINNKITNCKYDKIKNPLNNTCPILRTEFNKDDNVTIIKHCGHIISADELKKWFNYKKSCPLCNYNIETENYNGPIESLVITYYNVPYERFIPIPINLPGPIHRYLNEMYNFSPLIIYVNTQSIDFRLDRLTHVRFNRAGFSMMIRVNIIKNISNNNNKFNKKDNYKFKNMNKRPIKRKIR